ncbi:MAG: 3-deoxy-7-phosphoheptulonate synthase [Elusimicrobia bacterium]|nr:MAG: 3-deoxy-7-phosphoheptulonate synthase [Elusimicrobiota bacterium]
MLILMDGEHSKEDLLGVVARVEQRGFKAHVIPGANSTAVGVTGNPGPLDPREFESLPGVKQAIPVTKSYKLAGRDFQHGDTAVEIAPGLKVGGNRFIIMAGPCAVESREQTLRIARKVKAAGAHVLRGGAFKPRTSPYAFQGMGEDGLKILAEARAETGLPVVSEALDPESLQLVYKYADVIQIGARNMQNFALLKEAGKLDKPVLLKRGLSATVDEWLQSAEYLLSEGNHRVMLCERGIRTFSSHTRNTLDLNAVPVAQKLSHLPVLVDPSHGTGVRDKVAPLAKASAAVGAHGLIIEVHDRPAEALCDGPQAMPPEEFAALVETLKKLGGVLGYTM